MLTLPRTQLESASKDVESHPWFHSQWARGNCIVWGRARHADLGPLAHALSIAAAWDGTKCCHVNGRTIAVDDDNFLILNGCTYSTSIRALRPVESLAIYFKPELVDQVCGASRLAVEEALSLGNSAAVARFELFGNLQPHDQSVSPVLRYIRAHVRRGFADEDWYEEQLIFLLARMQSHHERLLRKVDRLAFMRPATRHEVFRRISRVVDHIHTCYAQVLDLATLAEVACLSKFHFLRSFALVHGMTPRTYLQRKRVEVAKRLLTSTQMTRSEIAAAVGFADESTLVRQMRRRTSLTPRQIRAGAAEWHG